MRGGTVVSGTPKLGPEFTVSVIATWVFSEL